jgi:hypothetical protein
LAFIYAPILAGELLSASSILSMTTAPNAAFGYSPSPARLVYVRFWRPRFDTTVNAWSPRSGRAHRLKSHIEGAGRAMNRALQTFSVG